MFSLGSNSIVAVTITVILVHLKDCSSVAGISLAPVFWNLTNPIFKASKNDHIIVVNLFDEIDFVCPYYSSTTTDASELEYYLIYRVSKKEYDDCNIYSDHSKLHILRCRDPRQKRRFTILFEPFQSIPNVPEYKAGHTYYFITPSTGRQDGLDNLYKGACLQHNMKLTIKVRDGDYEEEVPHRTQNNGSTLNNQWSDLIQEDFSRDNDGEQRGQISPLERSTHQSVPSNHGGRTLRPPSSRNNHRKDSQRHSQSNSDDSGQLSLGIDATASQRPLNSLARPTHSLPLHHHNTRTPKTHSVRNSHRKETHKQSPSNTEDTASVAADIPSNQEAFLQSGNDQPSPSSAQASWSSDALRLKPFRRSPIDAKLILTAIVTVALAIDRWRHV